MDNIYAGDQIFIRLDQTFFDYPSREDFVKAIKTEGPEQETINKLIAGRSIIFFKQKISDLKKIVFSDGINSEIKELELNMQKEAKACDAKIAEIDLKIKEIEKKKQAWINKKNSVIKAWQEKIQKSQEKLNSL